MMTLEIFDDGESSRWCWAWRQLCVFGGLGTSREQWALSVVRKVAGYVLPVFG